MDTINAIVTKIGASTIVYRYIFKEPIIFLFFLDNFLHFVSITSVKSKNINDMRNHFSTYDTLNLIISDNESAWRSMEITAGKISPGHSGRWSWKNVHWLFWPRDPWWLHSANLNPLKIVLHALYFSDVDSPYVPDFLKDRDYCITDDTILWHDEKPWTIDSTDQKYSHKDGTTPNFPLNET